MSRLLEAECRVYEINPVYTKQRRSFRTKADKSDPVDAKLIADVLTRKLSELPRITKAEFSSEHLCLKKTVWFYEEITIQGARLKNQLRQLQRERSLSTTKDEQNVLDIVIQSKKKNLKQIQKTQEKLERELDVLLGKTGKNLTTIKGIGTLMAAKIIAHANGIERFATVDKFVSYAGIAPVERSSGKSRKRKKNKMGNRRLHSTFYLAAVCQIVHNPKAKEYYEKKIKEGKTKQQALFCVMRRIACIVYGMLKSGEDYRK